MTVRSTYCPSAETCRCCVGGGGNVTVHAGNDGILMVDSGSAGAADKIWAAVQSISRRPLRYIVNTNEREDYSGGNEALSVKGSTIPFRPPEDVRVSDGRVAGDRANVISYLTVFHRMSAPTGKVAARPEEAWPDNTYSTPQKKLYFNDEPVVIMHVPSNTDGNSIVHFRGADVISVGDLLDLTGYPRIDIAAGGSIDAVVQGLYRVIEITVPNRKSEAGTLVIPGRGPTRRPARCGVLPADVGHHPRPHQGHDRQGHDARAGQGCPTHARLRSTLRQHQRGMDDGHVRRGGVREPQEVAAGKGALK